MVSVVCYRLFCGFRLVLVVGQLLSVYLCSVLCVLKCPLLVDYVYGCVCYCLTCQISPDMLADGCLVCVPIMRAVCASLLVDGVCVFRVCLCVSDVLFVLHGVPDCVCVLLFSEWLALRVLLCTSGQAFLMSCVCDVSVRV